MNGTPAEDAPPSSVESTVGGSATGRSLETAQADRTKMITITLPAAYRDLGLHLQAAGGFAADFPDLYRHLNQLLSSLVSFASGNGNGHARAEVDAKTIVPGHRARTPAQHESLKLRINQVLEHLGEAAFMKHGEASGPPEIIQNISEARSQLVTLDDEIAVLSKSRRRPLLSVKKLLNGGLLAVMFMLIGF
jgi:hypothetical protein